MATKSFEKALQELEGIVSELEDGDLHLEKAFKKFAEGVKLSKLCSRKLDETEKKISLLLQDENGKLIEIPFEDES
jgi:exodeoxyribonuclease VII small subunit